MKKNGWDYAYFEHTVNATIKIVAKSWQISVMDLYNTLEGAYVK